MYLIFDTETTGLPKRWDAPVSDTENWPRCIQIAWQLHDAMGNLLDQQDYLIQPDGFNIPYDAEKIHGISTELAREKGHPLPEVLEKFNEALARTKFVVGQNVGFDINIMGAEFYRANLKTLENCPFWIHVQNIRPPSVHFREDAAVNLSSLPLQSFISICLMHPLKKRTMPQPM